MRSNLLSNLKPVGVVTLTSDGLLSLNYRDRHVLPLTYALATKRVAPDHPATVGPLHTPITFHLDVNRDTDIILRIRSRQLPVIKHFIRGQVAPNLIGYEVVTADTLFKPYADSGAINIFASSSEYADSYGMPPIDITIPASTQKSVIQVTFYSLPLNVCSIEAFSNQGVSLTPGSLSGSTVFTTTRPGWLTTVLDAQTGASIDTLDAAIELDGSPNPGTANFALITGTTWWQLLQEHLTLDILKSGPSSSSIGQFRVDTGDEGDIMEGCLLTGGICHFDPTTAATTLS